MLRKYFAPIMIIALINAVVVAATTPKTSTKVKKVTKEESGCELVANFDDYMNQKWPEIIDSDIPEKSMRMNINETPEGYHIEAELPGVKKEDIKLVLKDNNLIISGEKKSFNEEKKKNYLRIERSNGSFYRSIALPRNVDKDKITSKLSDGVLKVDIQKLKDTKSTPEKKIEIL